MSVAAKAVGLTDGQRKNAEIIEREFLAAGFTEQVAAAAIVNAIAESGLNAEAVGDHGKSIGLFQLHEKGGGYGMTAAQRKDPTLNTKRIIEQAKKSKSFMEVATTELSIPKLAAAFSTYVERPSNKAAAETYRAALAARYFPSTSVVLYEAPLAVAAYAPWWMWAGAVTLSLVALYGLKTYVGHRRVKDARGVSH